MLHVVSDHEDEGILLDYHFDCSIQMQTGGMLRIYQPSHLYFIVVNWCLAGN